MLKTILPLFVLLTITFSACTQETDPEIPISKGIDFYKNTEYDKALREFNAALKIEPEYADAYVFKGITYEQKNEQNKAIEEYGKALEIDPMHEEALYNRGMIYLDSSQYEKAIDDFTRVIELDPAYHGVVNNRGVAYMEMKEYEKAIEDYSRAIEIEPQELYIENRRIAILAKQAAEHEVYLSRFPSVTADQLLQEYSDNEAATKQKWGGKEILITGYIRSIEIDFFGRPIMYVEGRNSYFEILHCIFPDGYSLTSYKKGNKIRIKGTVGSTWMAINIYNCSVE